jgi:hypothetical protein
LDVLEILEKAGARIAVVFHDAEPFGGTRIVDRLRRALQVRFMRRAVALSDAAVFTVPPGRLSWTERTPSNGAFIPVGANLPGPLVQDHQSLHDPPTVAVYSITGGASGEREARDIVGAVRFASEKLGRLRLLVFGRHAELRNTALQEGLQGLPVALEVHGLLDVARLLECFSRSDVLLFVRGTLSSRRSSALSGIACGLPVVAFEGPETAWPVTDAGVILLPQDLDETSLQARLGESLVQVFSDAELRRRLVERSRGAYREFFSWDAVARRYAQLLRPS